MARLIFVLVCVLVLQLSKASCQETNWICFSGNEQNDFRYFYTKNIVKTDTTILVWIESISSKISLYEEQKYLVNPRFKYFDMNKTKELIDFKNNKFKVLATHDFLDNKEVASFDYASITVWQDIMPETIMEVELIALKKYLHIEN